MDYPRFIQLKPKVLISWQFYPVRVHTTQCSTSTTYFQSTPSPSTEISVTQDNFGNTQPHLVIVQSVLTMRAVQERFKSSKLTLRCLATMFTLYRRTEEIEVQEDAPQLAPIMVPTTQSSKGKW